VLELKYRHSHFDTTVVGRFECSDPLLNSLWHKAANTMLLNMRDGIQDPDRERSQWWGDVVIIIGMIAHSCDEAGFSAVKKAIHNLVDWQKPDGVLYSPVPAGNWFLELPDQMLAAIGKYDAILRITLSDHLDGMSSRPIAVIKLNDKIYTHNVAEDGRPFSEWHETTTFFAFKPGITVHSHN
jgi:hypothetical protein